MSIIKYTPPLNQFIAIDFLPEELSFVQDGIDSILENLFVAFFQTSRSQNFNSTNYSAIIRFYKKVTIDIPATGLSLILNPDFNETEADYFSDIPISFSIDIPIKKYFKDFSLENFSGIPQDLYNLVNKVVSCWDEEIIKAATRVFYSEDISELISEINTFYSLTNPIDIDLDDDLFVDSVSLVNRIYINEELSTNGKSPTKNIFELLISDLDNTIENLDSIDLIYSDIWRDNANESFLNLFVPKIVAEIYFSGGIFASAGQIDYLSPI